MKYLFLIQARTGSTRFPNKVLSLVNDKYNLIELVYFRTLLSKSATPENTVILTSDNRSDDKLVEFLDTKNILYARGDEDNVYGRFYNYLNSIEKKPEYIIRICGDNPFLEPLFIDEMIKYLEESQDKESDYLSFETSDNIPVILSHFGFFCEIIKYNSFMKANSIIRNAAQKEHVTPIFYNTSFFKSKLLPISDELNNKKFRFTIDTESDLHIIKTILKKIENIEFSYMDVLQIVKEKKALVDLMSKNIIENEKK